LFCQIETRERKASHWLRQNKFVDAFFPILTSILFASKSTKNVFKKF
jgi:hypothetical protein